MELNNAEVLIIGRSDGICKGLAARLIQTVEAGNGPINDKEQLIGLRCKASQ